MQSLAYEALARDILLALITSKDLQSVERERLIAYETYHLPSHITLTLPDADGYERLLNPHTRQEAAEELAAHVLHVVQTEERNSWVPTTDTLTITPSLSTTGALHATPHYGAPDAPPGDTLELAEALARVTIGEGESITVLRRGHGLLPVMRRALKPRISLLEATEGGHEVAFLVVGGKTRVTTADGRTETWPAHARIPIIHDVSFRVLGRRFRPWERPVEGQIKVLGISRAHRPSLMIEVDDAMVEWNRNREPQIGISSREEARVKRDDLDLVLTSGAGDAVEVTNNDHRSSWLTWFDGAPLLARAHTALPLKGSHLLALGHEGDAASVSVAGARVFEEPTLIEVHGWMPLKPRREAPAPVLKGLFGFERPVATIFEEGQQLTTSSTTEPIRVPVHTPELVKPLFVVALDGCRGAKIKPMTALLKAEDIDLHIGAWTWIEGVFALTLPGMEMRLEALEKVKLIYGDRVVVEEVSSDPTDVWNVKGWRLKVAPAGLDVEGDGRVPLTVDKRRVTSPSRLPPLNEHRVQAGRGLYRIVRRIT